MGPKVLFGILLGATIGMAVGFVGRRAGGTCPLLCNPYGGAIYGAVLGALVAGMLSARPRPYAPSEHLLRVGSEEAFEGALAESQQPVLVEFYTSGCPACRRLEPELHSLADRFAGRATVAQVNAGELRALSARYGIRAVPTLLLFAGRQEKARVVGYRPQEELAALLEQHMGSDAD